MERAPACPREHFNPLAIIGNRTKGLALEGRQGWGTQLQGLRHNLVNYRNELSLGNCNEGKCISGRNGMTKGDASGKLGLLSQVFGFNSWLNREAWRVVRRCYPSGYSGLPL